MMEPILWCKQTLRCGARNEFRLASESHVIEIRIFLGTFSEKSTPAERDLWEGVRFKNWTSFFFWSFSPGSYGRLYALGPSRRHQIPNFLRIFPYFLTGFFRGFNVFVGGQNAWKNLDRFLWLTPFGSPEERNQVAKSARKTKKHAAQKQQSAKIALPNQPVPTIAAISSLRSGPKA